MPHFDAFGPWFEKINRSIQAKESHLKCEIPDSEAKH